MIEMATATENTTMTATGSSSLSVGAALMTLAGIAFVGYAIVFFIRNFTDDFLELGIGANEVAVGREQIARFSPELLHYISHLHIAVSGFIAAAGVAVAALSWFGVRRGQSWAFVTAVAVPVLGLAVALPAHYPNDFDTVGHLGPIYLATAIFVAGALLALRPLLESRT
jgi:cytochrome bd-type quinol oxidase subunit 2